MEEEKKVEIVEKAVIKENGEKKEIAVDDAMKVDKIETDEEKMEVDSETNEAENKEDVKPLVLKVESESEDIARLIIEGIETEGDEDEEYVVMTPEEIRKFMEEKITKNILDPAVNPLLQLQIRSKTLLDEIRENNDEIVRVNKVLENIYKNQERFLRHVEIFPKLQTNNVSVSVDLPLLRDSVPLSSVKLDEEAVIRKDLPEAKVMLPSNRAKLATPTIPNTSSIPAIPSAITVTPTVPSAITVTPTVPNTNSTTPTLPNGTSITPAVPKASPSASASNVAYAVKSAPKPAGNIECIDLTDDTPAPAPLAVVRPVTNHSPFSTLTLVKHPAPLPPKPFSVPNKSIPNVPPKPRLKISSEERGIVLQWDMPPSYSTVTAYSKLKTFDIFGYQEQKNVVINTLLWKKIGAVKAMTLPMACTLTQFLEGQKYHFAIRAVDIYDRCGAYSDPISIVYKPMKKA